MTRTLVVLLAFTTLVNCVDKEDPQASVMDLSFMEGDVNHEVNVAIDLTAEAKRNTSVLVQLTGVTATEGEDFLTYSERVSIPAGSTAFDIPVTIVGDSVQELDEVLWLTLSEPENVTLGKFHSVMTIQNDDDFVQDDTSGYYSASSYPGMTLAWSDEFDGNSLDQAFWNYETGGHGWGNNESQYYRDGTHNAVVQNGKLIITAKQESYGGSSYTSARLTTQSKYSFKYGRVDVRAKLPKTQGIWPAIWLLGDSFATAGWPACGETDMMELLGHEPNKVYGTIHYGPQGASTSYHHTNSYTLNGEDFSDKYHVFSMLWEENSIKMYVDDIHYATYTPSDMVAGQTWRHNAPFFFILNIAVGGNWPGYPDASTQFPQNMMVDYIRVFQ